MTFDEAFDLLIMPVREGGYQDGRGDPGGETNMGITIATERRNGYTGDMRDLPQDLAKGIYLREYWQPACCDIVPDMARYSLFDAAVNTGPAQARRLLQRAIGVEEDGQIGPRSLQVMQSMPEWRVAVRLEAVLQNFRTDRNNWPNASRGWTRRSSANLMRL